MIEVVESTFEESIYVIGFNLRRFLVSDNGTPLLDESLFVIDPAYPNRRLQLRTDTLGRAWYEQRTPVSSWPVFPWSFVVEVRGQHFVVT